MHSGTQLNMTQFYNKVIQDFGSRLFNRYNQKEQGFDSQIIDQIKTRIKAKMIRPQQLFNKSLQIKHRSNSNQLVVQVTKVKKQEPIPNNNNVVNHVQQQIDYANAFIADQVEVKKQQGDLQGIIKHQINQDLDDQKDQEDQREKRQMVDKLKNNITVHIVGTYQPKNKKHIAKDQSTKLQLQNVFIKVKGKNTEIYVPKLICDFKKQ